MAFQINIEDLLCKRRVESNRIEFKRGWNPSDIYHSICAFANDFENLGGGYILVGVEQDANGIAKRPVEGLPLESLDRIMKDMVGYDAKIKPAYVTRTEIVEIDNKYILAYGHRRVITDRIAFLKMLLPSKCLLQNTIYAASHLPLKPRAKY